MDEMGSIDIVLITYAEEILKDLKLFLISWKELEVISKIIMHVLKMIKREKLIFLLKVGEILAIRIIQMIKDQYYIYPLFPKLGHHLLQHKLMGLLQQ